MWLPSCRIIAAVETMRMAAYAPQPFFFILLENSRPCSMSVSSRTAHLFVAGLGAREDAAVQAAVACRQHLLPLVH